MFIIMKKKYRTRVYKIYPDNEQIIQLNKHFGHNRFVWNKLLEFINNTYRDYKEGIIDKPYSINYQSLDLIVTQMKHTWTFLNEQSSITYQSTTKNLSKQFKNFFKNPKKFKHPKFKRKLNKQTVGYLDTRSFKIDFENRKIKIPKIGWVKIEKHQKQIDLNSHKLQSVTIEKTQSGKYYIKLVFLSTKSNENLIIMKDKPYSQKKYLGIDMGIKELMVLSTGEKIENPKFYVSKMKKLRRLQRQYSRKQKGSKNKEKQRIKLQKYHEKIKNIRKDYINKILNQIIDTIKDNQFDGVSIEDLNINGMSKNRHLSKSIYDQSWGIIKTKLNYKLLENGYEFVVIDRFYPSSQLCSNCHTINPNVKNLNVREWICPNCGTHHDRDINQQINIQNYPILPKDVIKKIIKDNKEQKQRQKNNT